MPRYLRKWAARLRSVTASRARIVGAAMIVSIGTVAFASCSVSDVLRPGVDAGAQTSSTSARGLQRLIPSNPMMVSYPRADRPSASAHASMPASEVQCRQHLRELGVTYRDLAPINDGSSCRIDYPVEVHGLAGNIEMKPAATLTCAMAASFAAWTRNELAPSARWRYFSGVKAINQGSSYSCRRIAGTSRPSEHSRGNALDVMSISLRNGRNIDVAKPGFFAFRERSMLNRVRAGGCQYFTTVLGPGYNAAHADHFHFDIMNRRNGYVACR